MGCVSTDHPAPEIQAGSVQQIQQNPEMWPNGLTAAAIV